MQAPSQQEARTQTNSNYVSATADDFAEAVSFDAMFDTISEDKTAEDSDSDDKRNESLKMLAIGACQHAAAACESAEVACACADEACDHAEQACKAIEEK